MSTDGPEDGVPLRDALARRLDEERARGVIVVGPTPGYHPSHEGADPSARPDKWNLVLQVPTASGDRQVVSGTGPTPDAAAESALAALDATARG